MSGWIDSHTHLETFARKGELDQVLERARAAGVEKVVTVGTSPGDWELYRDLASGAGGYIAFTAGLHPCEVNEDWEEAIESLRRFLNEGSLPVAIGETGLDRFHLPKDEESAGRVFAMQEKAFRAHLAIAGERDLPLVVHSRGAFGDCLRVIDDSDFDWSKVVFHCFADGVEEVRELNRRGGRASFTGIVTYKSADEVRAAMNEQGIDRLMLETDAPYLAPVPMRGKRNEPAYVAYTATTAARVLGVEESDLSAATSANVKRFFGLAD